MSCTNSQSNCEWKECKLGEVAIIIDCEHKTAPLVEKSDFLSVRTTDISNGRINFEIANRISEETYVEWTRRMIPSEEDIVLAREAPVGEVGWVDNKHKICLGQRTVLIRSDASKIFPRYLLYYLVNKDTKYELISQSTGSVVQHLNVKNIRDFKIRTHSSLPEQKAIASVLSSLDDKIDLLHRQNKTLEAMAETLFRQWFVEEAEEGWDKGKLPDEFDFVMGASPPGESYNEIGEGFPMYQGNADFGFRFPQNRVFTTDPKRFAEKYDTLISVRAPVGAQNMAEEKCCIGRGVAAFRYKKNKEFYTYTYFKMKSLIEDIKQFNESGTVFGCIGKKDFEEIEILIPENRDVENFQKNVKPIDDKIIENCIQIRTLEKLRDNLLPKLMSGEVRVGA